MPGPVTRSGSTPRQSDESENNNNNTNSATPPPGPSITSPTSTVTTQSIVSDISSNNNFNEVKDMLASLIRRMDQDRENNNKNNSEVNNRIEQILNQQNLLQQQQQQQVKEPQSIPLSASSSPLFINTPRPAVPTAFGNESTPSTSIPFTNTKRSLHSQLGGGKVPPSVNEEGTNEREESNHSNNDNDEDNNNNSDDNSNSNNNKKKNNKNNKNNNNTNNTNNDDNKPRQRSKEERELIKTSKPPDEFTGDELSQRLKVRQWVTQVNNWINLFIGKDRDGSSQELRMETVATRLSGGALIWYETEKAKAEITGRVLRWDEIMEKFIAKFEGQDNRLLMEQELELLTYKQGKCRDLYKLEAEFDRLRLLLYPNSEGNSDFDRMLGNLYGSAIQRGDAALHTKMLEMGLPRSLNEWKALATRAVVLRQHARANNPSRSHSSFNGYKNNNHSHNNNRSLSQQPTANNATVLGPTNNNNDNSGNDDRLGEGQEGQAENVPVQYASINESRPRLRGWKDNNGKFTPFTREEYGALAKNRRCFICYKKEDHRGSCPNFDTRPRRKPNADELKA
jgi:hypothetical protein